ncbi:hypothetical protein C2857_007109 [Epichloe festucae Fl1]|uniref:L-2-hydroxyglutarate dehydrogenase, mitochondrial n=1 Tax=Epichloe festucae (strain Fl1) TaxID=877507 RepID=A0A7S9PT79_EPIFF|nr:hypothetical protein C2857_007109 [Epichloe festucae Fl1]
MCVRYPVSSTSFVCGSPRAGREPSSHWTTTRRAIIIPLTPPLPLHHSHNLDASAAQRTATYVDVAQASGIMSFKRTFSSRLLPALKTGAVPRRQLSRTPAAQADFTHTQLIAKKHSTAQHSTAQHSTAQLIHARKIIGGGIVGLSIAHHLSLQPNTSTLLVERHASVGTETSSRNSEVIHAGIYYGADTLKTRLCLRGRHLLYAFCEAHGVGHRRTGKWIVAQTDAQHEELQKLHEHSRAIGVPTRWVSEAEVARDGEGVRARSAVLESPTTGIVHVHGVMTALEGLLGDQGGTIALNSRVVAVRPLRAAAGWEVDVQSSSSSPSSSPSPSSYEARPPVSPTTTTITSDTIVNAAGLGAVHVHNMIVPPERRKTPYYAKGNYFSYSSPRPNISRLIYPAPDPGAGGLGTHLTLDMGGRVRFGPDVEWVDDPEDLSVGRARLEQAVGEIKSYLPHVDETCLEPDYAGIRPKLTYGGAGQMGDNFNDFVVRLEEGYQGWVNCLGIESPGLTSSLAIGERVRQLLYGP